MASKRISLTHAQKNELHVKHDENPSWSVPTMQVFAEGRFGLRVGKTAMKTILSTPQQEHATPNVKRTVSSKFAEIEEEVVRKVTALETSSVTLREICDIGNANLVAKGREGKLSAGWATRLLARNGVQMQPGATGIKRPRVEEDDAGDLKRDIRRIEDNLADSNLELTLKIADLKESTASKEKVEALEETLAALKKKSEKENLRVVEMLNGIEDFVRQHAAKSTIATVTPPTQRKKAASTKSTAKKARTEAAAAEETKNEDNSDS